MRRAARRGVQWETPEAGFTWQHVIVEVLMDIREELQALNATLKCQETQRIPRYLRR